LILQTGPPTANFTGVNECEVSEVFGWDEPGPSQEEDPGATEKAAARLNNLEAAEQAASLQGPDPPEDPVQPCPLQQGLALEVVVTAAGNSPLPDLPVQLWKSDSEVLSGKTKATGGVRFIGLEKGVQYRLKLSSLDADLWKLAGSEDLTEDRAKTKKGADWQAPPKEEQAAQIDHEVVQGETIATIGFSYGCLPDTLWNSPANKDLKDKRKKPDVLYPGDKVVVPAKQKKTESVEPGKLYKVSCKGVSEMLRVRFLAGDDKPRKDTPYLITLVDDEGVEDRTGKTNGEGFLEEAILPMVKQAEITVGSGDEQEFYAYNLGNLDPIDTLSGFQERLNNMGYFCGNELELGPVTRRAVRNFLTDNKLKVPENLKDLPLEDKQLDDARQHLEKMYLS